MQLDTDLDTKILLSLIRSEINKSSNLQNGVSKAIDKVEGTVAAAFVFTDINEFVLATNNGSVYVLVNKKQDILFFASELNILKKFESSINLKIIGDYKINQLISNSGIAINLDIFSIESFNFKNNSKSEILIKKLNSRVKEENIKSNFYQLPAVIDLNKIHLNLASNNEKKLLEYPLEKIKI